FKPKRSMYPFLKITTTAKIEPNWITILNVLATYFVKNCSDCNHISSTIIMCPVEDIGANSVKPSTIPRIITLIIAIKSILCVPFYLCFLDNNKLYDFFYFNFFVYY